MNKSEIIFNLAEILGCEARQNEPMSKHTSFKIGGNADAYIKVNNLSKLSTILKECQDSDVDYIILGNGSNLLVSDEGIRGAVIRLDGDFRKITLVDDTTIFCGAGATLAYLCKFALNCGLSGLEFAWGIPGTVGGAVFMNAGAYDGEMKDVVHSVSHISPNGEIGRTEKDDLRFGYRTSIYRSNNMIITGITLKLKKGNPDEIRAKMDDYMLRRSTKQPLEYPSAGSVFKRPEGNFAGALIEQCGLKGKLCGGAQVSEKHAGFIINKSNATAKDVRELITQIQKTVSDKTGYNLECELIIL
ncbi:UDP-N-acetylmuramate dehydrogenase [Ruminococcus sp.]|uniref:UDP-N-acetylmuramate dehydrogenase n=1 Tax=Ruminococcus sp. TaxID=41978 RepID=UPI0026123DB7|nr:UDP-N-acetylmuramate dehydrogenase [Ruminococcus sp.]MDD6989168.1 UDP-N-acetylmuramate dehydrogenase [Ruminococcus sp.]MDY6202423.1 UDP-N-acetylmuramate dehydrogenase [Ruminococcus sp.]